MKRTKKLTQIPTKLVEMIAEPLRCVLMLFLVRPYLTDRVEPSATPPSTLC